MLALQYDIGAELVQRDVLKTLHSVVKSSIMYSMLCSGTPESTVASGSLVLRLQHNTPTVHR
jgi:hypothetical protein